MNSFEINKKLIELHGVDIASGNAKYRVVWSSNEVEKRIERNESGLRVREVKKYLADPDKWVLEVFILNENPELTEVMSYEPLYFFQDKHGDFLPLNWEAIEYFLNTILNREPKKPRTLQDDLDAEAASLEKSKQRILAQLIAHGDSEEVKRARLGRTIYNSKG